MDLDRNLVEMEQAANILLNPGLAEANDRNLLKISENVFINFSKSKMTIPDCLYMLKSNNELVLFETVKMMKNILVYEWRGLNENDIILLRQKLLQIVIDRPDLQKAVAERLLQIVSIMVKRKYIEDNGTEWKGLMETIRGMIFGAHESRVQHVSTQIIVSILQEFTNTVKSEDVCLSFEEHFRCKKMFETRELPAVFQLILECIEQLILVLDLNNSSQFFMIESSVKIMELVLSWSYITAMIPKRIIKAFENLNNIKQTNSLRLSVLWQSLMLRRRTIEVFFIIYWRVRDHGNLQQRSMNCLIQLSTLSGPIFQLPNSSFDYFKNYVELLLKLMKTIENDSREAFGIATIIRKLLMIHNVKTELIKLEESVAKEFLGAMLILTCKYIENSVTENLAYDTVFTDASRNMLEAWLDLMSLVDLKYSEEIKHHSRIIFEKFIECHLNGSSLSNDQEVNEMEDSEREIYKEQLIIIGFLGRLDVEHSLNHLAGHLEAKLSELCNFVGNPESVERVFDALTWLIMISGHVLCMDAVGEKPLIPREINELSLKLSDEGKIDSQSSLDFLQSSVNLQSVSPSKCDPSLRILADVLRLCEMENRALDSGFGNYGASWSPLVSTTIVWFIGMFTKSYLYVEANYYCPLATIYGELLVPHVPNAASNWCMEFILRKLTWNLYKYHHEKDVIEESIRLFLDIVNQRNQKLQYILQLPSFQNLIQLRDVRLDSKVKRSVYKGLIMATAAFANQERQDCLRHLLETITNNFDAVLIEGIRMPHDTSVRERLIVVLDELTGVAQGLNGQSFGFAYQMLSERFHRLPDMMLLWRNYIDIQCAILQVLQSMATVPMTNSNSLEMARDFYEVCLRSMRCYMEQQGQRLEKIYSDEEEQPDDVLMIVELFKKLTVCLQYVFEPAEPSVVISLGTVVLANLMPKMYPILQRFPDIAMTYYKSLNCFLELLVCNNELPNLPVDPSHLLYTIKVGLTSFAYPEIQGHSLDLLTTIADAIIQDSEHRLGELQNLTIEPFGKLLFEIIASFDLFGENKTDCFGAIYTLGCASRVSNSNFCHEMITALADRQRNRSTYVNPEDTPEVEALKIFTFKHSREQKMAFIDLLDKFISSICFLYHN